MAQTVDLFIDSDASIETLAREVESLLGIRFRLAPDAEPGVLEYRDGQVDAILARHELENDRDMNFEDYPYQLSVRGLNIETAEQRKTWRDEFARRAFDALKRTRKYPLMLVFDVQKKLDEFNPRR